jgi:hypothetical protein
VTTVETTQTQAGTPPPRPGSWRRWPLGYLVGAGLLALVVLGFVVAIARAGDHPAHTISAQLDGRHTARLELVSGVTGVTVHSGDIGDDLYRISTPAGAGAVPSVADQDGAVQLSLTGGPASSVDIVVNPTVTWQFRLAGGANEARLDLRAIQVSEVDVASGVSTVELWLPRPHGSIDVRETGGANAFIIHTPTGVPAQLGVAGGAGTVVIDGTAHTGVGAGQVYTPDGWDAATDRYDIDCVGGVSRVSIDRY